MTRKAGRLSEHWDVFLRCPARSQQQLVDNSSSTRSGRFGDVRSDSLEVTTRTVLF
ncbi:hypothetical protein PILCRDRAFT_822690 [Piloderma croceum F 1598]|uniref:Uncharacterized protein n=1 Tax=Piloderma croceum (strain F 1598) TaxID=765440 RepID=A0A0C3B1U7_PILCF|nr:hypothetical protein PILCRDRAFT_822690 [Piloderma croceum F 1598]